MATVIDSQNDVQTASAVRTWKGVEFPAPGVWVLDKSHTTIEFTAKHLMVAKVKGRFAEFEGQVDVAEDPRESRVNVTIEAASVDTREEKRDAHLRSPDFFDVETYPRLAFRGAGVEHVGGTEWRILGELTIKDVTLPVALDAEFDGGVTDPWGGERVVFSAETRIKREDYGLTWNVALETGGWLVGSDIRIGIEVEAVRQTS
jgi:polyisoprenoid-binding protein YceI